MHVATAVAVEPATDGASLVTLRLVRHVLRRREVFAMKRATIAQWGRRYGPLVMCAMTVIGTLAIAGVLGTRMTRIYNESRVDTTRIKLKKYVYEAYPSWRAAEPDRLCPGSLRELDEYMTGGDDDRDSWGRRLEFRCGPGARGLWVRSAGEDGTFDTADDLDSLD
jgi:hypothetical protein